MQTELASPFLNTDECAVIFRVGRPTIRRWCADGRLRAIRIGREFLVDRTHVEAVMNDRNERQPQEAA
jgi:excisionase family DNA binding protein